MPVPQSTDAIHYQAIIELIDIDLPYHVPLKRYFIQCDERCLTLMSPNFRRLQLKAYRGRTSLHRLHRFLLQRCLIIQP